MMNVVMHNVLHKKLFHFYQEGWGSPLVRANPQENGRGNTVSLNLQEHQQTVVRFNWFVEWVRTKTEYFNLTQLFDDEQLTKFH